MKLLCLLPLNPLLWLSLGPCCLTKVGISDHFYPVHLNLHNDVLLTISVPSAPDGRPSLALILCLLVGWVSGPQSFLAVTETIANINNTTLHAKLCL